MDGTQSGEEKHVLCMGMPPVEGVSRDRKDMMIEHGTFDPSSHIRWGS